MFRRLIRNAFYRRTRAERPETAACDSRPKTAACCAGGLAPARTANLADAAGRTVPARISRDPRDGSDVSRLLLNAGPCGRGDASANSTLRLRRRDYFFRILVLPDALGQKVAFEFGEGPRLAPIGDAAGLVKLEGRAGLEKNLGSVFETLDRLKTNLPSEVARIGFCGAPWTVASYMNAGRSTRDKAPA